VLADSGGADYEVTADQFSCKANNNGMIELDELLFEVGAAASYRVNPPGTLVPVENEGKLEKGKRVWDHSSVDGMVAPFKVEGIEGNAWYASHFPDASFVIGQDLKAETLQVLRLDKAGNRVLLLGLVSRKPDWTLLIYQPPITIMRFPLKLGLKFTSSGEAQNGKLEGVAIATKDKYEVEVDAAGLVRMPTLELTHALRQKVRVQIDTVGGQVIHAFQYQWFQECFGEVVRTVAQPTTDGTPPPDNFKKALEYRRLSF
jgi:hypothetical protein